MLIAFSLIVTICVGTGILDYSRYEWFIIAVLVQTFLQIIGIGYVAVRLLFSD